MKTDELITLLANGGAAAEDDAVARRYAMALGWGAFGAMLLMALLFGVRADIAAAARLPMFWVKLAVPAIIAIASVYAACRLSRPGGRLHREPWFMAVPVVAVWLVAAYVLLAAPPADRMALVMGSTWQYCLLAIPLLSLPILLAVLWAMKGLAPTRLAIAGGIGGLLAGSIGGFVYALHCPEMDAPFLGVWYVAGMLIPALVGMLAGPRLLRW